MCYQKIERENGNDDEINFIFRFINLTESEKKFIEKQYKINKIDFEINSTNENGHVVFSKFTDKLNVLVIGGIINDLKLDESKYGIFASIISFYDQSGFSFPKQIVEFTKCFGGNIDVSVINLFDE